MCISESGDHPRDHGPFSIPVDEGIARHAGTGKGAGWGGGGGGGGERESGCSRKASWKKGHLRTAEDKVEGKERQKGKSRKREGQVGSMSYVRHTDKPKPAGEMKKGG